MPDITVPNNLFEYRVSSWEVIVSTLEQTMARKDQVVSKGGLVAEKIYEHLEAIYRASVVASEDNALILMQHGMIRYLDPFVIQYFVEHPEVKYFSDLVAAETNLVDAMIRGVSRVSPYKIEELEEILQGKAPYYNDITFLNTLHTVFFATEDNGSASLLFNALPQGKAAAITAQEFNWDDIVMLSALVQVAWKSFIFLTLEQQKILLQNYFYTAVVMGVPVKQWLSYFFRNLEPVEAKRLADNYVQALVNSNESVPTNTDVTAFRPLPEVLKEYLVAVYSEDIGILAQEKYLSSLYGGQAYDEFFIGWLREVLGSVWRLKKGELY